MMSCFYATLSHNLSEYFIIFLCKQILILCTAILNVDSKYIFYGKQKLKNGQQKLKSRHTFSKYGQ